jgi:hypothetical protein
MDVPEWTLGSLPPPPEAVSARGCGTEFGEGLLSPRFLAALVE